MCAQGSFKNIIFGGRTSQNAVLVPTPTNRHLLAVCLCMLFVSQYTVSPIAFSSEVRDVNMAHGAHCFCIAPRRLLLKHRETLCGGSRPWQAEVSSRHGRSPTQSHLYGKPNDQKNHKPQGFLNKTSRSLLWNLFFLWRLEQKHTCKSVSLLVRIITRTCEVFSASILP